jgi:single-strand DNA-binding protein
MYQNKVTLIGFLGNNAEVHTADERSFTTFQVATKSSYKDKKSGEYVSHTEWHRCVVFSGLWEFAGTLTKGTHVQVEGELRSREYVPTKASSKSKKAEMKQRVWEIRVASILKLDRAEKSAPEEQEQDGSAPEEVTF